MGLFSNTPKSDVNEFVEAHQGQSFSNLSQSQSNFSVGGYNDFAQAHQQAQDKNTWNEARVLSNIRKIATYDTERAQKMYSDLQYLKTDKNSKYYNPYAYATNKAVTNLNAYGIDTSKIDDNFFQRNSYLTQYLIYNGTTNSPSKPGTKASTAQKAAYEYYQIWKSEEATAKAENQWAQLQKELTYWTQQADRNLSDEEVLAKIDWSKYSELTSMDANKYMQPNEYNRAIGYSRDAMLATIWKARNPEFNGTLEDAMVGSYLGAGNRYVKNPELTAKLDAGNKETYSPYSVGSTMEKERLYFGVSGFDRKWCDDHRAEIANSGDETAKKYFANIVTAVEYTDKLKAELKDLYTRIDEMISGSDRPNAEWIIKSLKAMDTEFGDLFDLDSTLDKALTMDSLKQTASAVDYRWVDVEKMIRERCDEANTRPNVLGMTTGLIVDTGEDNEYRKTIESNWNRENANRSYRIIDDFDKGYIGNIDLNNRQVIHNPDGSISTESSFSTEIDGKEVLLPTIINGKRVSEDEAIDHYIKTGENLGIFDTPEEADDYAQRLHERQEAYYGEKSEPQKPPVFTDAEQAQEEATQKSFSEIADTVKSGGTQSEKTALMTGATSYYDQCVERLRNSDADYVASMNARMRSNIARRYGENFSTTSGYESMQTSMEEKQNQLEKVDAERSGLQDRKNTMEAIGNLSPDQYANLVSYVNNTDEDFEFLLNTIRGNENEAARVASAYDLYYLITGEPSSDPQAEVLQKAESWVKFLDAGRSHPDAAKLQSNFYKPLSVEETARLTELNRWRDTLNDEIQQDNEYLTTHEKEYSSAKLALDFDRAAYTKACNLTGDMDEGFFRKIEDVYKAADKATKKEYASVTPYDYNVANGMPREEATKTAVLDATNATLAYTELSETYKQLKDAGVKFDAKSQKNIEAQIANLRDYGEMASYAMLDGAEDFQSVVDAMVDKTASGKGSHDFITVDLAMFLKNGREIKGDFLPEELKSLPSISKEEAARYFYLLNSDQQAADKYIKKLCDPNDGMLTVRAMQKLQADTYAFASQPGLNPYIATGLGLAAYVLEAPQAITYRVGQGLKGEAVSPYNSAYDASVLKDAAIQGSKDAIIQSSKKLFGDNNFIENALTRIYDIGFGGAELAIGSETMGSLFEAFGVPLGSITSPFVNNNIAIKMVESAAEVLPSTLTSAEEKYRSVLMLTNDEDKAAKMYNASLISGLLTHSVIMTGMHNTLQSNPTGLKSAITNMFEKIVSNDAAIGASTMASSTISELVDKYVMEEDSRWQSDVYRFHNEMHYPLAVAEQMADQAMWQRVADQTWDSIINSTIRTAAMTGIGYVGGKIESGLNKAKISMQNLWQGVKQSFKDEFIEPKVTWSDEETAEAEFEKEVMEKYPEAFEKREPGYNKDTHKAGAFDQFDIPENMVDNELGVTRVVDRTTGQAYNVVGYVENDNGTVDFITTNGAHVPFMNVVAPDENGNISGMNQREFGLLSEAYTWWYTERGGQAPESTPLDTLPVEDTPVTQPTVTRNLPAFTAGNVTPDMIQPKDLQTYTAMFNASQTGASVALTSLLNSGDYNADKAASQIIVGEISKGDPRLTAMTMMQIAEFGGLADAVDASLTSGKGNSTLRAMFDAVSSGKQLTSKTVAYLKDKVAADRLADPKGFNESKQAKITELLVANKTNELVSQNKEAIKAAEQAVDDAKVNLAYKQQEQAEAEANKDVALQQALSVLQRFRSDLQNSNAKARLQQSTKAVAGAEALVQQKKNEVALQKEKVTKTQKKLKETQEKAQNEARKEAQDAVADEKEQNTQKKIEQATFKPNLYITERVPSRTDPDKLINKRDSRGRAIRKTVTVYDDQGKAVNLIGVYDVTRTRVIYMTDDGRLVMEGDPSTRGKGRAGKDSTANHRLVGDVIAIGVDKDLDAAVNDIQDKSEASKTKHPAVTPVRYLPSSFPLNINGQTVQIIGLAGKQVFEDHESPVLKGLDGKNYSIEDPEVDAQLEGYSQHSDIIFNDFDELDEQGRLKEIPDDQITHFKEATNDGEPEGEQTQEVQVPVQGNEGEGNNGTELAEQSGQPVGFGDNSDAEPDLQEPQTALGGGEESETGYNRPPESRVNARFRSIISERLRPDQSANDPNLQDEADRGRFSSALNDAITSTNVPINPATIERLEQSNAVTMLSPDGMAGFAVGTQGEDAGRIITLFNNRNSTTQRTLPYLVANAIEKGGYKLDAPSNMVSAFDRFGFSPVAVLRQDGKPDTYLMLHTGDPADTVCRKYMFTEADGGYHRTTAEDLSTLPVYDDPAKAEAYRNLVWNTKDNEYIVTHSISTEFAIKALENGKLFGPSIGITRPNQKSSVFKFGTNHETTPNVTFFINSEAIDPQKNPLVRIFGGDAWTPLFPEGIEQRDGKYYNVKTGQEVSEQELVHLQFGNQDIVNGIYKEYKSLDEMKADLGRLVNEDSLAIEGYLEKMFKDTDDLATTAAKNLWDKMEDHGRFNDYEELSDHLSSRVFSNLANVKSDKDMQVLLKDIGVNVSEEAAGEYKDGLDIAVGALVDFIEAKIAGTLSTSYIDGAKIPEGDDVLEYLLEQNGIPFAYWTGDGMTVDGKEKEITEYWRSLKSLQKNPVGENGEPILPETQAPAQETPKTELPPHMVEQIALTLDTGKGNYGLGQEAAKSLFDLCDGDIRLMRSVIEQCFRGLPKGDSGEKRDIIYASLVEGKGQDALVNIINKVRNGDVVTNDDVNVISDALISDFSANPELFQKVRGIKEQAKPTETPEIVGVMDGLGFNYKRNPDNSVSLLNANNEPVGTYTLRDGYDIVEFNGDETKLALEDTEIDRKLEQAGFEHNPVENYWFRKAPDTQTPLIDVAGTGEAHEKMGGFEYLTNALGLQVEEPQPGVRVLTDFRGNTVGYLSKGEDGIERIDFDPIFERTEGVRKTLEEAGYVYDDNAPGGWILPQESAQSESIVDALGLKAGEAESGGMIPLVDSSGNNAGYMLSPEEGTPVISLDDAHNTPEARNTLKEAGFNYNPQSGEWTLGEPTPPNVTPPSEPPTPPNVTPPTTPTIGETPRDLSGEQKERQWNVKGAQQSDILSDKAKKRLMKNRWYTEDHNEDQFNRANEWIKSHATENDPTGLYGALNELESGELNLLNVDNHVRLMVAIAMASEAGDEDAVARLSDGLFASSSTEIAQALQASKIWMTMNPTGRKIALKREADRIRDAYQAKGKNLRFAEGQKSFKISNEALEAAANAETEEEFLKARRMMELEIAKQIPSDMQLRLRTFRMTSMLANPRTHLRNIIGNITGALMVEAKNAIGAGLETARRVPKEQRQKAIGRTKESIQFALNDFPKMKDTLQGGNKFFEMSEVERNRKAFGSGEGKTALGRAISRTVGKGYQKTADWSSSALEAEDVVFLKYHYTRALSGFMTARGLKPEDMKGKVLAEARAYAVQEAQKATYRSPNQLATWLNSIQWKPARKTIDAVQPFVKTPSNIVKMGFEYSPAGFVSALKTSVNGIKKYQEWEKGGFKGKRPHGAVSPAEVADKISAGLTGTAIAGLGAWLFSMGILKVKATDAEKRNGAQDYSLEIGGQSIGIGNLVPFNIPLMLGATIYDEFTNTNDPITGFKDGDYAKGAEQVFARVLDGIKDIAEPVVDTTMMSSLNSLLNTTSYSSGDLTLGTLGEKVIANYISSYYPSFLGAVAKTIDPTRRKAFTESGDKLSIWKSMIEQTVNKIPFLSTMNVPYINAWGEEENLSRAEAFLQNFVFPDKIQSLGDDELDTLLEQLSTKTSTNLQPTNVKTLSVNGKNVKLNEQQWYTYNKLRGQLSKSTLQELIERPEFITLSDYPEVQAELIKKAYKYAKAKAATAVFAEKEVKDGWTRGALNAENVVDYIFAKEEESAREASNDEHRESLYNMVMEYNADAAKMDVSFLQRGGVKDESIRNSLTRKIKPMYQELYKSGLHDDIERLEAFLKGLEIGYTDRMFAGWIK